MINNQQNQSAQLSLGRKSKSAPENTPPTQQEPPQPEVAKEPEPKNEMVTQEHVEQINSLLWDEPKKKSYALLDSDVVEIANFLEELKTSSKSTEHSFTFEDGVRSVVLNLKLSDNFLVPDGCRLERFKGRTVLINNNFTDLETVKDILTRLLSSPTGVYNLYTKDFQRILNDNEIEVILSASVAISLEKGMNDYGVVDRLRLRTGL